VTSAVDTSKLDYVSNGIVDLEAWGKRCAQKAGLEPIEMVYDSSMLNFVFEGSVPKGKIAKLDKLLRDSQYIKAPWACGEFSDSSADMGDNPFETVYTLVLYNTEEE